MYLTTDMCLIHQTTFFVVIGLSFQLKYRLDSKSIAAEFNAHF